MSRPSVATSRHAARASALRILYTLEVGRSLREDVIRESTEAHGLDEEGIEFARALVLTVDDHRDWIDDRIARHAAGYPPDRHTVVDKNILRLAVAELGAPFSDATPAILVSEALALAKTYSTPEAARFIHGVLGGILDSSQNERPLRSHA
ncbi:MAG: transcription antitermination protein NusB [Armatimonadota bacterium]